VYVIAQDDLGVNERTEKWLSVPIFSSAQQQSGRSRPNSRIPLDNPFALHILY
jgi:hypothetical protein